VLKALLPAFSMSRLLWLSGAALAVGAVALAAAQAWFVYGERLRDERAQLASLAAVLAEQTERAVQAADLILRDAAEQLSGLPLDMPEVVRNTHIQLSDRINGVPQARAVLVLNRNGESVIDSASLQPRKFNGADRDPFRIHRDNGHYGLFIGTPVRSPLNDLWTIILSRRIDTPAGGFGGVVTLALDPAYFSSFYGSIGAPHGSSIVLLNADGVVLSRHPHDDAVMGQTLFGPNARSNVPMPAVPAGALTVTSPIDGQQRLMAYKYLNRYPLLLSVSTTVDAAVRPAMKLIWMNIAAGAVIAALVLALFAVLARQARGREQLAASLHQAKLKAEHGERQAISETKSRSQFWSSLGHELRSPLNAVVGFAEMLQSDLFGKPTKQQIEYAGYIKEAGEHLLGLINDLMDVARMEAGRMTVKDEEVDLLQVAEAALGMARPLGRQAGIEVALESDGLAIAVRGDELRLRQVLLNLLGNAIKYSNPPGKAVLAVARTDDGGVALTVADTGIGMTGAEIAEAQQPFGRANNKEARQRQGTGLGLSIVKHLVELHDGTLEIASERGKGTTVTIRLPASRVLNRDGRARAAD